MISNYLDLQERSIGNSSSNLYRREEKRDSLRERNISLGERIGDLLRRLILRRPLKNASNEAKTRTKVRDGGRNCGGPFLRNRALSVRVLGEVLYDCATREHRGIASCCPSAEKSPRHRDEEERTTTCALVTPSKNIPGVSSRDFLCYIPAPPHLSCTLVPCILTRAKRRVVALYMETLRLLRSDAAGTRCRKMHLEREIGGTEAVICIQRVLRKNAKLRESERASERRRRNEECSRRRKYWGVVW